MPDRYTDAIVKFLSSREYQPLKPRQIARQMGVGQEDYGAFRLAVKRLRDTGRAVLGGRNALMLPEMTRQVVGVYRANPRGFGFLVPDTPNAHGDLFIPRGAAGEAMNGDRVQARVKKGGTREGKRVYEGEIVRIIQRGQNRFVGTLQRSGAATFVMPDGPSVAQPIVIRDAGRATPKMGTKVVVEITRYPEAGQLPAGVIVEVLGDEGQLAVETDAVIRAHGIPYEFSEAALAEARAACDGFDPTDRAQRGKREDMTGQTVITIDPDDARDFDDAISLSQHRDGTVTLGVHIADVSHFVVEGGALDDDARTRATSAYFPRRVVPMLPEILSNGVCSLQEGQRRFCKSVLIHYDTAGEILGTRLAETVICSTKRLTYGQAQGICEGKTGRFSRKVVQLVRRMEALARLIEARRRKAGMIHLDLPACELVLDDDGKVVDAVAEDDAYTHTIIEMFMVEANDAVAAVFDRLDRPIIRRIHPSPDPAGQKQLGAFTRACGYKIPANLTRYDIQALLEAVKGRPESYAVNLAVLRTYQQAEYSPMRTGHFALASTHYCHFTSPIRRYADLTVHRMVAEYCRQRLDTRPPEDMSELITLADHCSQASRRAEAAERELREVLVLQLLVTKVGEGFDGVITGVTNFGLFVRMPRFNIEGLVRMQDLGDDWWDVDPRTGTIRGQRSGQVMRIGDVLAVRIAGVDVARRQLNLVLDRGEGKKKGAKKQGAKKQDGKKKDAKKQAATKNGRGGGKKKDAKKQAATKSGRGGGKKKGAKKQAATKSGRGGGKKKGAKKQVADPRGAASKTARGIARGAGKSANKGPRKQRARRRR